MSFQTIIAEKQDRVGVITFNRPEAMNALNVAMTSEIAEAVAAYEADSGIGCIVMTGSDKAFAAGGDIKEMETKTVSDLMARDFIKTWERIAQCRKPIIAAVRGVALGGGCEVAMMCDMIIAGETARFGQPEIKLGVIPGAGGTQRLARSIGKAKAMDLCLTGRMMDAAEAERCGLVSRIVPDDQVMAEAMKAAQTIAGYSLPSVMTAKEAVDRAFETPLAEGVMFERRVFQSLFATDDQKEGMAAFVAKRKPEFKHR